MNISIFLILLEFKEKLNIFININVIISLPNELQSHLESKFTS
jgi:hypothetical protein